MAAIDRFDFLLREIFSVFAPFRDSLALVGAFYATRKTFITLRELCSSISTHFISRIGRKNLVLKYGKWAVVTGSTHGIGKAYAYELASYGMNIVLISRGEKTLKETAADIEDKFRVETHIIPVDFNGGRSIYGSISKQLEDKEIGILVNNVGVMYEFPQYFLEVPVLKLWQLINVNVAAATMMTHIVLPQMVDRGRGIVVNMASGACSHPTPQMSVYAATQAYLDYFSRALHHEYADKGITVQCLMPFYVATRMSRYSDTLSNPSMLIPSASVFVRHAVNTLGYSTRTTGYWPHTLQFWLASFIPERLWMWGATQLNNALRNQAQGKISKRKVQPSESAASMSDVEEAGPV